MNTIVTASPRNAAVSKHLDHSQSQQNMALRGSFRSLQRASAHGKWRGSARIFQIECTEIGGECTDWGRSAHEFL